MRSLPTNPARLAVALLILAALACTQTGTPAPAAATASAASAAAVSPSATASVAAPTVTAATSTPPAQSATEPTLAALAGSVVSDATYCTTADGVDLKFDLYYPPQLPAPAPVIVYLHGGGWSSGDKRDGAGLLASLAELGYLVASR
jgi:acetyl esterase/lipase